MNYDVIVTLGAIFMAFGFIGLIWSDLKNAEYLKGKTYLPFFPGIFTIGGIMMILVGFISPLLLQSH
ncbi:hypothetical protein ACFSCX_16800 [Bacillus salitolerans]|uniref:DUF3995 domain-containing protein n=1 Tax=Bacillus salitolerans TaxID=1437434 RepID=A0ABW4LU63_9BACI